MSRIDIEDNGLPLRQSYYKVVAVSFFRKSNEMYHLEIRHLLLVMIAVAILTRPSLGQSDTPSEKPIGDGNSVTETFFLRQAAIDSYDVRVKRWSSVSAKDVSKAVDYPTQTEEFEYRMVMSHSEKKCFVFSRQTSKQEATERYSATERISRVFSSYSDGKMMAFRPEGAMSGALARNTDYSKFLSATNIDYPAFLGGKPLYYANASLIEKKLLDQAAQGHQLSLEVLPDGMFRVQTVVTPDSKSRSTQLFDPHTFAPKRCSIFLKSNSIWDLAYSHEMDFIERELAVLPVRGNFSYEARLRNNSNLELKSVLADQIGTVEVEWLKVGDPRLEFPDWQKAASSVTSFEKFLDPSQFESAKSGTSSSKKD